MVEPILQPEAAGREGAARYSTMRGLLIWSAVALVVLVVERVVTLSPRFLLAPGELGNLAVVGDLAIFSPLMYWILVVKRARVSGVTVIPVISLGLVAAGLLLPDGHRDFARWGRLALAPAELGFVLWAVQRARQGMQHSRERGAHHEDNADFLDHLRAGLRSAVRIPFAADAVAFELALLYYALLSWRARPHVPAGAQPFTTHKKSGVVALLLVAAFMTIVETSIVHLVVMKYSNTVAWIVTALSIYGVFWIVGFMQAIRLRPILITEQSLLVRLGMLSAIEIPYDAIESITKAKYPYPDRGTPGYLRAMLAGDLHFVLQLKAPIRSTGAYGRTREISLVGISLDEPAEFQRALESKVEQARSKQSAS